jgi:hypothetical protein
MSVSDGLPTYTVLVPLTHGTPRTLLHALAASTYPPSLLDVKLLEPHSSPGGGRVPMWVERVCAAPGALYASGLARARGRYVAAYEPTDQPEADLLRSAVTAFDRLGMGCAALWVDGRLHVRRYAAVSVGGWAVDGDGHDDLIRRLRQDGFTVASA